MKLKCVYNTFFIGTKTLGERDFMMEEERGKDMREKEKHARKVMFEEEA